jgi:hypothetical protein
MVPKEPKSLRTAPWVFLRFAYLVLDGLHGSPRFSEGRPLFVHFFLEVLAALGWDRSREIPKLKLDFMDDLHVHDVRRAALFIN